MRRKVLLINPRMGWRPALGLLYIASYVRQAGYEVKVIEFVDEDFFPGKNDNNWREFYNYDPDFIGLGIISWNRRVARGIIENIRATTKDRIIICGGKDPSFKPEIYFKYDVDFVVYGEGEETMVELLDGLNSDAPLKDIKGLVFKKDGRLIMNKRHKPIDVSKVPFPALDLVDYDHYCEIRLGGIPGHFIKTGFLMANRGCPYNCRFCTDPVRSVYRERSTDDVIDEIKWQIKNWNIPGLVFLDDLFYFSDKRMIEFCERILEEGIKLKLYAQTRVDRIGSPETLALMKKAGFIQLALGVESGSQDMLDTMNKMATLDQSKRAIRLINESGIYTYAFMILGFPEESREDLDLTAQFLKDLKPTFVTVNYFMSMPGTQYYNEEDEHALEELSFSLTENQQEFRSPVPHDEILKYRRKFLSAAKWSANLNLLRYPSFYIWAISLVLFHPAVILRGLYLQMKNKTYTSYFEAVRTSMINYRIYGY